MTATDLLSERFVDKLTDLSVTPITRLQVLSLTTSMTPDERQRVARLIDRSCIYVRDAESVTRLAGTPCGLEDWHALASEIRAQ